MILLDGDGKEIGRADPPKEPYTLVTPPFDVRNSSYITIVDTYSKSGKHLKSVAKASGNQIVWDEGRIPSKDVVFFPPDTAEKWAKAWGAQDDPDVLVKTQTISKATA